MTKTELLLINPGRSFKIKDGGLRACLRCGEWMSGGNPMCDCKEKVPAPSQSASKIIVDVSRLFTEHSGRYVDMPKGEQVVIARFIARELKRVIPGIDVDSLESWGS